MYSFFFFSILLFICLHKTAHRTAHVVMQPQAAVPQIRPIDREIAS